MAAPARIRHSVIMPVHQGEAYLDASLASLHRQHDVDPEQLEIVAVDDGSTDASPDLLRDWSDRLPLRVLRREGGSNWMAATNAGLREARGDWLHFLHQDDLWAPERLHTLDHAIERFPGTAFFCHSTRFIDPEGRRLGLWRPPLPIDAPLSAAQVFARCAAQNGLAIAAPCFHRDLLARTNPLREDLWFLADWEFWLRLIHSAGGAVCLNAPLAAFRLHPASQTSTRTDDEADLRQQFAEVRTLLTDLNGGVHPDEAAARVNEDLTVTLANWSHGAKGVPFRTLSGWIKLGPVRALRFLRDTRTLPRVLARLRLRVRHRQ